jgi:signal transduction histidine kinase
MKERAELLSCSFEIESSSENGTTIYVRVPASYEQADE